MRNDIIFWLCHDKLESSTYSRHNEKIEWSYDEDTTSQYFNTKGEQIGLRITAC